MKTKDTPREIMTRIASLLEAKEKELSAINAKIQESNEALAKAKDKLKQATTATDLTAFTAAKIERAEAMAALEMYTARREQLENREFVSDKESDQVIDALLAYEDDIAEEFAQIIEKPFEAIREALDDYQAAVTAAETAIREWTASIHPNFRADGTTYPDGTNISKTPVPVRRLPYTGSKRSAEAARFIKRVDELQANE